MESAPLRKRSYSYSIIVVSCIFCFLGYVAIGLRLWARRLKKTVLCTNDYAIIGAQFFVSCLMVSNVLVVVYGGYGQHEKVLNRTEIVFVFKDFVAEEPLWVTSCALVKISILHLYVTIFPLRPFRIAVYILMTLVTCYGIGFILRTFLICRPLSKNWDPATPGVCGDVEASSIAGGITNLALDTLVILLPIPLVWRLQMAIRKKLIVTGIFSLGAFICIISVLRLVEIIRLDKTDITYNIVLDGIWTFLEPALGVVNACLPVLQPVLPKVYRPIAGATSQMTKYLKWLGLKLKKRKPQGFSKPREFIQLDDLLRPLKTTTAARQNTVGESDEGLLEPDLESQKIVPQQYHSLQFQPRENIGATKSWDVTSRTEE